MASRARFAGTWFLIAMIVAGASGADARPGGAATTPRQGREAFEQAVPGLTDDEARRFAFGNRLFETRWVIAPASVRTLDGLGPLYNRKSCAGCHVRDGRGRPPQDGLEASLLLRLSVPGEDEHGGPKPHPAYGLQLQDQAVPGVSAEGRVAARYRERTGWFADGDDYRLREPEWTVAEPKRGELGNDVRLSPRVAPAVFGLGLLEAVSTDAIAALTDEHDRDGDGVSGRMNLVWSRSEQRTVPGRFGWKANQPSLRQQIASALAGDIGITTSLIPSENAIETPGGPYVVSGGSPEMDDDFLEKLTFYAQTLAVPARRGVDDANVIRGERLFESVGCTACHVPQLVTGPHDVLALSAQMIHPYTDLLLHDMGSGLADDRPDYAATGREWRTPPLWSIGLIDVVNRHTYFLHDGRARNLMEAILWHGGEASGARDRFAALDRTDRAALIAFLESL